MRSIHAGLRDIQREQSKFQSTITKHGERIARNESRGDGLAEWMHRLDTRLSDIDAKLDRIIERRNPN